MTADPLDDDLIRAVGDQLLRFSRRSLHAPSDSLLDLSAFRLLRILVEKGPQAAINDLVPELMLDQSTVSRQVAAAQRRGLVERVPAEGGRKVLRPTEKGRAAYEHDLAKRSAVYRAALHDLGQDKVVVLTEALRTFLDALERADSSS